MRLSINTRSTWSLTLQARETRAPWSDISCLTHGYYIFSGYSKSDSGRHRISQYGSGNIEISLGYRRVWDRRKPIIRNKTEKCSEHSPKIGPLTDLHTR